MLKMINLLHDGLVSLISMSWMGVFMLGFVTFEASDDLSESCVFGACLATAAHPLKCLPPRCKSRGSHAMPTSSIRPSGIVIRPFTIIGFDGFTYSNFGSAPSAMQKSVAKGEGSVMRQFSARCAGVGGTAGSELPGATMVGIVGTSGARCRTRSPFSNP